jgi:hypothetical protein
VTGAVVLGYEKGCAQAAHHSDNGGESAAASNHNQSRYPSLWSCGDTGARSPGVRMTWHVKHDRDAVKGLWLFSKTLTGGFRDGSGVSLITSSVRCRGRCNDSRMRCQMSPEDCVHLNGVVFHCK